MIVDQENNRVIEIDKENKKIKWEYNKLNIPNSAELLLDEDVYIVADNNEND